MATLIQRMWRGKKERERLLRDSDVIKNMAKNMVLKEQEHEKALTMRHASATHSTLHVVPKACQGRFCLHDCSGGNDQ